jgi:thermostable 8-oxoguanine DNA glycosylase
VAFVSKPLSYIKNKGASDFLTTGFGLVKDHIALDSRILNVLHLVGVNIPERGQLNSMMYDALEQMLLEQVCRPLGVSGAELDQLLFRNYKGIRSMLGNCP